MSKDANSLQVKSVKGKGRVPVLNDIEARILFLNDHCCCICHRGPNDGVRIQIHHINEDPSDNRPENLAVLCRDCHDRLRDKQWMGKRFTPREITKYKTLWEKAVFEKRKHLEYPPAVIKETIREKVDDRGKVIERDIEREISYANGLAPQALGIASPLSLSKDKRLILKELKQIVSSQLGTEKLLSIFSHIKRTEAIDVDDMVVLSRTCLSLGDAKFQIRDYSLAEVFYKEALHYAEGAKEAKVVDICLFEIGAAVGKQGRHEEALDYFNKVLGFNKNNQYAWLNKSLCLSSLNRNKEAISASKKAINYAEQAKQWQIVADAYYIMGNSLYDSGKHEEAVDAHLNAITYGKRAKHWEIVASACGNMGISLNYLYRYEEAVDAHLNAITYGTRAKQWGTVANAHYNMGNALVDLEKRQEGLDSYLKAIQYGRKAKRWDVVAAGYFTIGHSLYHTREYREAVHSCLKAIQYGEKAKEWDTVADAYYIMGNTLVALGKRQKGLNSYLKAIRYGEKGKQWNTIATVYYNMGYWLQYAGRYEEAVDSYLKGIKYGKKAKQSDTVISAYQNMAYSLDRLGKYEQAVDACRNAVKYARLAKQWDTVASAYCNMGSVLDDSGKRQEGLDSYLKAIKYGEKAKQWDTVAMAYCNMGNVLVDLEKRREAVTYYLKAIELREFFSDKWRQIVPPTTQQICILGIESIKERKNRQIQELTNRLAYLYSIVENDGITGLLTDTMKDLKSELPKEDMSNFNRFEEVFNKKIQAFKR